MLRNSSPQEGRQKCNFKIKSTCNTSSQLKCLTSPHARPLIDMLTDWSCACKEGKVLGCRWIHYPRTKHSTLFLHKIINMKLHNANKKLEWFSNSWTHKAPYWLPSLRIPPKQNLNVPESFCLMFFCKQCWREIKQRVRRWEIKGFWSVVPELELLRWRGCCERLPW